MNTTLIRTSSLALATALLAPVAHAQAPAQTTAVEEDSGDIVVTARKREENLQDVPLSISAFSSATIEEQGLKSIVDIANVTPGLSFRQAFGRTFDRPVIRGMSNIQGAANVAFFLDGIFITGSIGGYNLDNLERVEVIKGPQSALFGRATFAGAVNYITRKPDDDFRGKISATVGEDGMREVSGYVSGPIVEGKLFAEVDGRVYKFGGQYTNVVDPVEKMGREESKSASATIRLTPTETLDIVARVGVMQDNDGAFPISRVNRVFGQAQPAAGALTNNGAINCFAPNLRPGVFSGVVPPTGPTAANRPVADNRARGYFCGEIPTPGTFGVNSNIFRLAGYPDALDRNIVRTSIRADLDINDWTLTTIGAYNRRKQISTVDQDYSDLRSLGFETIGLEGSRDYFGEVKLLSPSADRIRGIVGASYFRDKDLTSNRSGSLLNSAAVPPRVFQAGDDPTVIRLGAVSRGGVETKAVYGQVEADITEAFTVSAEGRYQVEEPESAGSSSTTIAGVTFTRPLDLSVRYKKFLPRVTANYKVTEDVMLYGVAAKGNKPGGFNTGVFNAVYPDAEVARLVGLGLDSFKEESAWSYEGGIKSSFMDNRLTLNVAGYYIDWKNQQLTQTIQAARRDGVLGSVSFTSNVGKSEVKGVEIEARGRLSENFSVRLGYAMQDSKIKSYIVDDQADLYITAADIAQLNATTPLPPANALPTSPAFVARVNAVNALLALRGNAAGNALPRVPKHQIQLGGDYDYEIDGDTSLFLRAQLAYESKRFVQVDNLGWAGDSYNLGLRAGVNFKSLTLTAYVTNTLNDKTPVDILRSIDNAQTYFRPALRPGEATANVGGVNVSSANPRDFAVTAPRLRNFGLTASYKF